GNRHSSRFGRSRIRSLLPSRKGTAAVWRKAGKWPGIEHMPLDHPGAPRNDPGFESTGQWFNIFGVSAAGQSGLTRQISVLGQFELDFGWYVPESSKGVAFEAGIHALRKGSGPATQS